MNKKASDIINRIKQDKKLLFIILLGFSGMLLLLLSEGFSDSGEKSTVQKYDISTVEEQLEKELTELLKTVDGVGRVRVMVTLDSLEERMLAKNSENGSDGNKNEQKTEYVLIENSGDTDGLTLKIITPVVRGVGISCEGASSSTMKQEIIRLVCSCLGVAENRVWVTKMQE